MNSHPTPERLLRQFAYTNSSLASDRLWEYRKGRKPDGKRAPKSATTIGGIYAHCQEESVEKTIEDQLAHEIENPVNDFIAEIGDSAFVLTDERKLAFTRYVFMLFQRSQARRNATTPQTDVIVHAMETFLNNERQVATVAAHWSIQAHFDRCGVGLRTREDVLRVVRRLIEAKKLPSANQNAFVDGIRRQMHHVDPRMLNGEWRWIHTQPDDPYMLGDSPVITFTRVADGPLTYGMGFWEPDVEVALPLSPTVCLHILPHVRRTRPTQAPTPLEINRGQAGFAFCACYCNVNLPHLDAIMQEYGTLWRMGTDIFVQPNRDYDTLIYEVLMGARKPVSW